MTETSQSMSERELRISIEHLVLGSFEPEMDDVDEIMRLITQYSLTKQLEELDRLIDIEGKTFSRWSQKDIAHFFDVVGKRYREIEHQLQKEQTNHE